MIRKLELLTVFTLCVLVLLGSVTSQAQSTMPSPSASRAGLSSLPPEAQGTISAALGKDDFRYWVHAKAGGFRAENSQHGLLVDFTRRGAGLHSQNMRLGLETRGYGYGDTLLPSGAATPHASGNRVEYKHSGMIEWYTNGPVGLEQGFTFAAPPGKADGQPLTVALALSGDLLPTLQPGGTEVTLTGKDGQAALRYTGLDARDATGRQLRNWLELRGERLLLRVDDSGARYPVVVDPWVQQAELTASDGAQFDSFGAVAVSGSTAVVGAAGRMVGFNQSQGAAYVFVRSGTTWTQQAELIASDGAAYDYFGSSVAVTGSTVVVGAWGHTVDSHSQQGVAYVFVRSGTTWSQQAELTASDGAFSDEFGASVAVSDSTALVGAPSHTVGSNFEQGAAYVFVQSGTTWSQQAELTASDGAYDDRFGDSVAVSGSTSVVGAYAHTFGTNNIEQGAAYVFVRSGLTWGQQAELKASDGMAYDAFGWSVAVSGSTAVVGAWGHKVDSHSQQGAAYVFARSGTTWSQQAELTASDGASGDLFGWSVAVSGSTAVVGAVDHTVGSNTQQGEAYVFLQNGTTWSQQVELTASDGVADDIFGSSVAVSGSSALVGAPKHSVGSIYEQGAAYVFIPPATLTPASASYTKQKLGTTSGAKKFTLTNEQNVALTHVAISTTGDFAVSATTCTTSLAAHKNCTISVTFTPQKTGPRTGELKTSDNASNNPQTARLTGTGD